LPLLQIASADGSIPGRPTTAGAHCSLDSLEIAVGLARSGSASAVVTGPVSKEQLYGIGFSHPGQTEFVAERCGIARSNVAMMLAGPTLRTVPVTTHMPLARVFEELNSGLVESCGRAVLRGLQRNFGIAVPRLAVAGFYPHAGVGGALGREEIEIIAPGIDALRSEGWRVSGPGATCATTRPPCG
jgi:4-hydroxythreonine-4-phosphate dehydrogenase